MREWMENVNSEAKSCACAHEHQTLRMHVVIEEGAILWAPAWLRDQRAHQVLLVCDASTYQAAGRDVHARLQERGIRSDVCCLAPEAGEGVIADERTVMQVLLRVSRDTDYLLAVGSGTIHDIVRFVAGKTGKPFVSVPTAASVDGFTSAGAPLILQNVKKTVQAIPPEAVFADTSVLMQAPREMTAAGFGDMVGKITSLADWEVSRDFHDEPFCPLAYAMTSQALERCIRHIRPIAEGKERGIRVLMEALIESGLSMLLIGHSRPASGGEHHVSHMWEMERLHSGEPPLLHGSKVGVSTVIMATLYRRLAQEEEHAFPMLKRLPGPEMIASWLNQVGGAVTIHDLGLSRAETIRALKRAPDLRDRYTALKYIRDHKRYASFLDDDRLWT